MSGYSSAWFDASQVNIAASAAAAASNSRCHQLYAASADDDCLRPAAPVASCRPFPPTPHHNHHYDVKQLQHTPFSGATHLLSADMSAYSDDRYSMAGSYYAYSSCRDCSPPPRAAALTVHGRLAGSVFDAATDFQRDCSDVELTQHIDGVTDIASTQLANNDSG